MFKRKIEIQCYDFLDPDKLSNALEVENLEELPKTKNIYFYQINLLEECIIHNTIFTIIHSNGFRFISPTSIEEIVAYIEMVTSSPTLFEQELLSKL